MHLLQVETTVSATSLQQGAVVDAQGAQQSSASLASIVLVAYEIGVIKK